MNAPDDWVTFMAAYAAGRWDPQIPPVSDLADVVTPPLSVARSSSDSSHSRTSALNFALQLPIRVRNLSASLPSSTHPVGDHQQQQQSHSSPQHHLQLNPTLPNSDVRAAVATMRLAAAHVDISPLALPSPEHELTDPMRGVTAAIPGSHSRHSSLSGTVAAATAGSSTAPDNTTTTTNTGSAFLIDHLITPGGTTSRLRLPSFWVGTTDVEVEQKKPKTTTALSAVVDDDGEIDSHDLVAVSPLPMSLSLSSTPPSPTLRPLSAPPTASAPPTTLRMPPPLPSQPSDYFGDAVGMFLGEGEDERSEEIISTPVDPAGQSALAQSRRILHTRQSPSPVPSSIPAAESTSSLATTCTSASTTSISTTASGNTSSSRHPGKIAIVSNNNNTVGSLLGRRSGKGAVYESSIMSLGYLVPPVPPDEMKRRRAMYKFNIWHTGADPNFDRIVHLVKLVFNPKCVVISLMDEHEQWFKSEYGCKTTGGARESSFCAHTILQRGDEPMVILDASNDWRFAQNPATVCPPFVRFYAGAPLRTQDGYNIGTLAIFDDQPREEFSPRQRHTLKEFAAITMREMELWRDKIQLRIRERIQLSMEQFSRECLEIESDVNDLDHPLTSGDGGRVGADLDSNITVTGHLGSSMEKVYDRAAKLVKRTLDVEGVLVMDVSQCEMMFESLSGNGRSSGGSVVGSGGGGGGGETVGSVSITMHHGEPGMEMTRRQLMVEEGRNLMRFFDRFPEGRISEGIVPQSFKPFLPTHVQYALMVPIFNIDKRPFALLCAYNAANNTKRFLEGHELSYLRAIGVIILSAVLKRRMILADKAKGEKILRLSISHELRTPLHGILAAAELLSESPLNPSQSSFLQTVQACGTSLVETVNHVLDFTKLSGGGKAGGVDHVIVPTRVDLMQLVEEAVDGCWIGFRARSAITGDGIGSVYSPPRDGKESPVATTRTRHVETVVDIGYRREGWTVKCEKGGIRRVLMNLFGNSLKFTSDGYIHVILRQLPPSEDDPPNKTKVELSVFDTGKGISESFLKNQLFHPFSQENPLQTGTGLGLAIVSSIVTSENMGGKVDVWSEEGAGTEIKVTFPADVPEDSADILSPEMEPFRSEESGPLPTISLVGFSEPHRGTELLKTTTCNYLKTWWGFQIVEGGLGDGGDIVIVNEETGPVVSATKRLDISRPFIILSSARGNPTIMSIAVDHERIGGFCRILYKPSGPSRLRAMLKLCVHAVVIAKTPRPSMNAARDMGLAEEYSRNPTHSNIFRRKSEETPYRRRTSRPDLSSRSPTANAASPMFHLAFPPGGGKSLEPVERVDPDTSVPTITVGTGGTLLKASLGSVIPERRFRILVVEDNSILRNLLIKWLSKKDYDLRAAVDGHQGVKIFENEGPFDVVLLDLTMPVLDGFGATIEIRNIESKMKNESSEITRCRILALTGRSSIEDKRRAFEAGVDGYLVKPVAFKTLDEMFHKMGIS